MDFSSLLRIVFPVYHGLHCAVVSVIHGDTCRPPVYQRIFSCLLRIFPVNYSWAFVCHSSMFIVVGVLAAVSYTVAEYEWIFPLIYGFFSSVSWSIPCSSLSDPWYYLHTAFVSEDFFLSITACSCTLLLGICASVQYVQSS